MLILKEGPGAVRGNRVQKSVGGGGLAGGRPFAQTTGYLAVPGQVPGQSTPLHVRPRLDPEVEHALNARPPPWDIDRALGKPPLTAQDVVRGLGLSKAMETRLAKIVAREVVCSSNRVQLAKSIMDVLLHEGLDPAVRQIINHRSAALYKRVLRKSGFREVFRPSDVRLLRKAGVKYVAKVERQGRTRYFYDSDKYKAAHGTHVSQEEGNRRMMGKNVLRCVAKAGDGGCAVDGFRELVQKHGAGDVHRAVRSAVEAGELSVKGGRFYAVQKDKPAAKNRAKEKKHA